MTKHPEPIYVFDLDGVITDPKNSQVDQDVVAAINQLLTNTYVAVNTGRSFEWVEQNLIGRLRAHGNERVFTHFVAVCEKGGERVTYVDGEWAVTPSEFALPHDLYEITQTTFNQNKEQLQSMFWDSTKRTMATIEKLPAANLDVFHAEQILLVDKLSEAFAGHEVKIDPTTIATDIESPAAGKHAGAQLVYEWVGSLGNAADHSFVSFGDSVSDYEMARYFAQQGAHSTFVYVGLPTDKIVHGEQVMFVSTTNHYAAGALEFLTK